MREPRQTRRQFLRDFVGPPRRPKTDEERAAAMAAYEEAMTKWRAECGDLAKRKNNFHRIADAEHERANAGPVAPVSIGAALAARRDASLRQAAALCSALPKPSRT